MKPRETLVVIFMERPLLVVVDMVDLLHSEADRRGR